MLKGTAADDRCHRGAGGAGDDAGAVGAATDGGISIFEVSAVELDTMRWQMWSAEEVAQWVAQKCGMPQYAAAFVQKRVHGSLLQSISTSQLKDIGVIDPEHRWTIMRHIQALVVDNLAFGTPLPGGALGALG